jgi:hypothetical protein
MAGRSAACWCLSRCVLSLGRIQSGTVAAALGTPKGLGRSGTRLLAY